MRDVNKLDQITLAIPSFNAAAYLPRVLDSVLQLTQQPSRTIIIDDGSSDQTGTIAQDYQIEVIRHAGNQGLGAARQTALTTSKTEWVAMIDSDVTVDSDWLSQLWNVACELKVDGVGGNLLESHARSIADRWRARMMAQTHGDAAKADINLFGCNTLHRVSALREVGGFNRRYTRAYEDIDISERLQRAGFKLVYTPTAKCHHLRRDSIYSVLRAAFSWRLPRFEEQGVYTDPRTLMGKWIVSFREDLRELQMLLQEADGKLSFPSFVQIFANPLQDFAVEASSSMISSLAPSGGSLILKIISDLKMPEELKGHLNTAIQPFIESLNKFQTNAGSVSEDLQRLMHATAAPWSSVLTFSPDHLRRLTESAAQSYRE